eukprot:m51a1_g5067 hypothetical protein (596) ;mRNA; r:138966-143494
MTSTTPSSVSHSELCPLSPAFPDDRTVGPSSSSPAAPRGGVASDTATATSPSSLPPPPVLLRGAASCAVCSGSVGTSDGALLLPCGHAACPSCVVRSVTSASRLRCPACCPAVPSSPPPSTAAPALPPASHHAFPVPCAAHPALPAELCSHALSEAWEADRSALSLLRSASADVSALSSALACALAGLRSRCSAEAARLRAALHEAVDGRAAALAAEMQSGQRLTAPEPRLLASVSAEARDVRAEVEAAAGLATAAGRIQAASRASQRVRELQEALAGEHSRLRHRRAPPEPSAAEALRAIAGLAWAAQLCRHSPPAAVAETGAAECLACGGGLVVPMGVAVAKDGSIFVSDCGAHVVHRIDSDGRSTVFAGTCGVSGAADGPRGVAMFNRPEGILLNSDTGELYVADSRNNRICCVSETGVVVTIAGSTRRRLVDGVGRSASFQCPHSLAFDGNCDLLVGEDGSIRRVDLRAGGAVTTVAGTGRFGYLDGQAWYARLNSVAGMAFDRDTRSLFFCDWGGHAVRMVTAQGSVKTLCVLQAAANPAGMSIDDRGLVVLDYITGSVFRVSRQEPGKGFAAGRGCAVQSPGRWAEAER